MAGVVITMYDERTRLTQGRRARAARAPAGARVQDGHPAQRPRRRGAQLRHPGRPARPALRGLEGLRPARGGGDVPWLSRSGGWGGGSRRSCPRAGRGGRSCSELPGGADRAQPRPAAHQLREGSARRPGRLDQASAGLLQPLIVRPAGRRPLRAGRRGAPLARRAEGGPGAGAGGDPGLARGRAPAGRADREHGPRGPEPGRRGARLRRPGGRPRDLQGGAGPPGGPQPRRHLQPDPPARPARPALELLERGELSEGHGRALLQVSDQDARASLAKRAAAEGWSVRETERRTRAGAKGKRKPAAKGGRISAEERAAMTEAEDALGEALGRGRPRPPRRRRGQGRAPLRGPRSWRLAKLARRLRRRQLESPPALPGD